MNEEIRTMARPVFEIRNTLESSKAGGGGDGGDEGNEEASVHSSIGRCVY